MLLSCAVLVRRVDAFDFSDVNCKHIHPVGADGYWRRVVAEVAHQDIGNASAEVDVTGQCVVGGDGHFGTGAA